MSIPPPENKDRRKDENKRQEGGGARTANSGAKVGAGCGQIERRRLFQSLLSKRSLMEFEILKVELVY